MFNRKAFADCINERLVSKQFGAKRRDEIMQSFDRLTDTYVRQGYAEADAAVRASADVFEEIETLKKDKARGVLKALTVHADTIRSVEAASDIAVGLKSFASLMVGGERKNSKGAAFARAAISQLEQDPRLGGISLRAMSDAYLKKYQSLFASVMDDFSKGAFGTRRGSVATEADIQDELWGKNTGNKAAKAVADAIILLNKIVADDYINAGGKLFKLNNFRLPQRQNAVKMQRATFETWSKDMESWLDWSAMHWPDGSEILPEQRAQVLEASYFSMTTDGTVDFDLSKLRQDGSAVGDLTRQGRFLVFKDGASWGAMHAKYGDGTLLDVISSYMQSMSHTVASVNKFGRSPLSAIQNMRTVVLKKAADAQKAAEKGEGPKSDLQAVVDAQQGLKRLDDIARTALRSNPMDPNSFSAAAVTTTGDLLTGAYLGSTPLLAVAGDFINMVTIKLARGTPLHNVMGTYFRVLGDGSSKDTERLLLQGGLATESTFAGHYAIERYGLVQTHGPSLGRTLSDFTMRLSGINAHTDAARAAPKLEMAGMLANSLDKRIDGIEGFDRIMRKYGIEDADWDTIRSKITPTEDGKTGTHYLMPTDILKIKGLANKDELYTKFAAMFYQEAEYMVLSASLESKAFLTGSTRPDTLPGAILYSASMFKNFPTTLVHNYGRMAMSMPTTRSRLGFLAAIGMSTMAVGLIGTQLREVFKGREPLPMDDPATWGKAFLAGGALGMWGDFLFSNRNEYGRGLEASVAGPVVQFYGDVLDLIALEPYAFVEAMYKGEEYKPKLLEKGFNLIKYNTPGTSTWWARLPLERYVWDNVELFADPNGREKQLQRMERRRNEFGNDYWWRPGEMSPDF